MDKKVEPAPYIGDFLKNSFHLTLCPNVKRHHNWRLERSGERINEFFCLFVQIRYGEFGAQRPKCLCAAPSDRLIVGDPDDKTFLAFEKPSFHNR
jgi:hypothetical protein